MTDMHPHWHATGTDAAGQGAVSIPVHGESAITNLRGISRAPAAIAGIALMLFAGFWAAGGTSMFTGQAIPSAGNPPALVEIHIKPTGPSPRSVVVAPGKQVAWINDDTAPHIVASDTLRTGTGDSVYSSAIFPGMRFTVTVAGSMQEGAYTYRITTKPLWTGSIIVKLNGTCTNELLGGTLDIGLPRYDPCDELEGSHVTTVNGGTDPSTNGAPAGTFTPSPDAAPGGTAIAGGTPGIIQPSQPAEPAAPAAGVGGSNTDLVPYNPYTVVSGTQGGVTQTYEPEPAGVDTTVQHSNAPTQPDSGPEVWVVGALSLIAMGFVLRKYLHISVL